jgi:hypothetical protein
MQPVRTLVPADAHFEDMVTLFVALAAVSTATTSYANVGLSPGAMNVNEAIHLGGKIATYSVRTHSLMHGISSDRWPVELPLFRFTPASPPDFHPHARDLFSGGMQQLISHLVGSAFLRYYEEKMESAKPLLGSSPRNWPPLWRFAWLIRNAVAHGGAFTINDSSFPATTWRTFSVSGADSGRNWFDMDAGLLGGGDIVELVEELEASELRGG